MMSRFLVATALVVVSGSVAATQTLQKFEPAPEPRRQVDVFEGNLRTALVTAGGKLAERAREILPEIKLWFDSDPIVEGVIMPGGDGVAFIVEPPGILPVTAKLYEMYRQMFELKSQGPLRSAGNTSTGPGAVAPPRTVTKPMDNPGKEYGDFVYAALLDALLDNALALPLRENQKLTLIVGDGSFGLPKNPLEPRVRKLYLELKGEDLLALRQNRISRDEARKRIIENRY